ncbi:MAG: tetratricopeptide repeat protein [Candidatus Peribacteraceae bacterium]|jgi:tetratricopeptide (TPR) repeat protein|nr:hypothetical protein [bacterium]MDP6561300.1 tetratricopeptide repeat protein [Candidatus Peribacteraceae bacterium]|tara:strand:- start:3108 stop:4346 length:1239 start_codon:yes stop_codon:yes gene_type:complete
MAFLWWQLTQSTLQLSGQKFTDTDLLGAPIPTVSDIPIDSDDASLLHLRQGDIYALRGEWEEAQEQYESAVKSGGGLAALRKLAQAQLQRRDMKGIRSTLKKLKNEGARPEDVLLLEIIIQLRAGELVDAKKVLESADDSPQKHYGLALLTIIQGSHERALQELALTINGWDPVLRSYARTLNAAYDEFALFPNGTDIHLITLLSRALAQVQECELALPLLIQVTSTKEDYRDAWVVQGYCELTTERPEQSLASMEQAYSLDPQKPEIQYFLARAYAALHEYQNAITFFEYALTNGFIPQGEVRRLIARYALEIGNAGLAVDQYEALTNDPNATFESYQGYVTAAAALGQAEEALQKAKLATEKWPKNARSFELLGTVAAQLEKKAEAKAAYEKALKLNPNLPGLQEKLQSL